MDTGKAPYDLKLQFTLRPMLIVHQTIGAQAHCRLTGRAMQRFKGKVAIVTGAGSGIGQGIAKRLGCEGAKVIVDYIGDPDGARETLAAIEKAGSEGEIIQADVTRMDDVNCLVDTAWSLFGSAEILVNNAGDGEEVGLLGYAGSRLRPGDGGQPARTILSDAGVCSPSA